MRTILSLCSVAFAHGVDVPRDSPSLVVASSKFSLVVDQTGKAFATGSNAYGQLGINSTDEYFSKTAVHLPMDEVVVDAAAGHFHSLFVLGNGKVFGAGRNDAGQLGTQASQVWEPVELPIDNVKAVAAGYKHSLFLLGDGSVKGLGLNGNGQLGDGSTSHRNSFVDVQLDGQSALAIAAGYDFSYFLTSGGVWACGQNLNGQLGVGDMREKSVPMKVQNVAGLMSMAAGDAHGLFVTSEGKLMGTGANKFGQIGCAPDVCGERTASPIETQIGVVSAAAGGASSAWVGSSPALFVSGDNSEGQLGVSSTLVTEPATADEVVLPTGVSIGAYSHSLFSFGTESIMGCGDNSKGQLGDGSTDDKDVAVQVMTVVTTTTLEPPPTLPSSTTPEEGETTTEENGNSSTDPSRGSQSTNTVMDIVLVICGASIICVLVSLAICPRRTGEEGQLQSELANTGANP